MAVEVTTLPSGLRVVTNAMGGLETASLGVWVGAGSRHERAEEQGLSHLIEHMAFKGTARRSARVIAEEIESAGGDLNAATSVENTAYYARVLREDCDLALDILSDILCDSLFAADELAREQDVILQEIAAAQDTPDDLIFDLFNAAAFPDQAIGRAILGAAHLVKSFDSKAIHSYLERAYRAGASVVAAAGAVEHQAIVAAAQRRFEGLNAGAASDFPKAEYRGGQILQAKRLEQTHIVVGFAGLPYDHPDNYAAHIFANAVGGGMASRLFQEVRETRGLAYSIYAFHWSYLDAGLFGFYAATGGKDAGEVVAVSLDAMAKATRDLTHEEVARAKAQTKVALLTALESSSARAEQIARQLMIFGRVLTRAEIIGAIDALSVEDVRAAGARMLRARPTLAGLGAIKKIPSIDRIAALVGGL